MNSDSSFQSIFQCFICKVTGTFYWFTYCLSRREASEHVGILLLSRAPLDVVQFIHVSLRKPVLHLVWLINSVNQTKFLEILMTGWLEIGRFLQKQSVSKFSNCAWAVFNWVLSMMKTNPRIGAGVFCVFCVRFLTYLCYED